MTPTIEARAAEAVDYKKKADAAIAKILAAHPYLRRSPLEDAMACAYMQGIADRIGAELQQANRESTLAAFNTVRVGD